MPRMERLARFLARAGIASRRRCERLISEGRVKVNGQVVTALSFKVDGDRDEVRVDGRLVHPERLAYYALYKPRGYICSLRDPWGRKKVTDLLTGVNVRVYPVGRLDLDSEGLLLLTNDGELAYRLTHPRFGVKKRYLVWVRGRSDTGDLARLSSGVVIEGKKTSPCRVRVIKCAKQVTLVEMVLTEGRKREVRRMWEAVGYRVVRLRRVAFGCVTLRGLAPGDFRPLTSEEVKGLRRMVNLE